MMTYCIIERTSGNVVASFATEEEARAYVNSEIDNDDEWALIEFGPKPTDNRLVSTWGRV